MKKICFVTTISSTLKAFVLKTAEYIHENTDWNISFICDYDEEFEKSLPSYIHYIPVKMERGISFAGVKAMLEMRNIFIREKFDLIQYSTPNASLYAAIAGKLAKVPVRLYCQWGMVYISFSGIKRKIFKLIEKTVCRLSTHIQPDSKSNLNFSHNEGLYAQNKGSVIWNGSACGVNLEKFDVSKKEKYRNEIRAKHNLSSDDFVFGFVGRITRDKGVNELLEAYKQIVKENKNTYLMIVGNTEMDGTIQNDLYEWAQACENIAFTGYTTEVEKYLAAMDTYILPSYREGFGMGVVEAEAMGVPVIVTDIPGPIDAMVDGVTGKVIPPKNVMALKEAMNDMIHNQDDIEAYGKAAIKHATENFEQKQFLEKVLLDRKNLLNK